MDVKTFFFALCWTFSVILDANFHLLIENVALVCLDYHVDYYGTFQI